MGIRLLGVLDLAEGCGEALLYSSLYLCSPVLKAVTKSSQRRRRYEQVDWIQIGTLDLADALSGSLMGGWLYAGTP